MGAAERHRGLVAAVVFAAVVALRLPFATTHLWAWDSVLYARALERGFRVAVDPVMSRPHPPGYVWYVAVADAARQVLGDSNAALVLVSIVAGAACAALLWLVALRYVRPAVALLAALAFAASPVVWTYGEVAYPYTVLALLSLGLGSAFLRGGAPLLASLAFGVLSGARQDVLLLLAPLWLWSLRPHSARRVVPAAALVAVGLLTWYLPSALLSGGAVAYASAVLRQSAKVGSTYSVPANGLAALAYNAGLTTEALGWGLGILAVPLVVAIARAGVRRLRAPAAGFDALSVGLLVWTAPALAFYALVHIGEWGYVLSVLPALFLASAVAIDRAIGGLTPRRWAALAAASVVAPALLFCVGDGAYQAVVGDAEFSSAGLARHDAALAARAAYVRRGYPPGSTLIVARDDYLLVRYYLPEYHAMYWDPDPYRREAKRARMLRATNVLVFTAGLRPAHKGDVRRIRVAPGVDVAYFSIDRSSVLELDGDQYAVREMPAR
ncbi:MAG: hypothetical protein KGK34_05060 [Chloroflexota bacterium]|nr:hypothetical protein [Chloroflexota bacterium]